MKKGLMLLHKKNDIEIILESDGLTRIRPFSDPDNTVYYYKNVPAALSAYITRNFDKADFSGHIEEEIPVNDLSHHTLTVAPPHSQSDASSSR